MIIFSDALNLEKALKLKKQCDELGVEFVLRTVGSAADATLSDGEGVEEAIIEANNDDSVNGIMVGIVLCIIILYDKPTCRVFANEKVYYPIFGVQQVCDSPRAGPSCFN